MCTGWDVGIKLAYNDLTSLEGLHEALEVGGGGGGGGDGGDDGGGDGGAHSHDHHDHKQ